ncbi:hypothetical protein U1Q18_007953 [Sarracenia purpurea var. burkii]
MAVLIFSSTPSLSFVTPPPPSSSSVLTLAINANLFSRLHKEFTCLHPKSSYGFQINTSLIIKERSAVIAKASVEVDGTGSDGVDPPSEGEENAMPFENLPLESKLQLKLEQKMKMKLAKKIRLRRKKLVRKRRMRKKGRWPPSKMKKNKNV